MYARSVMNPHPVVLHPADTIATAAQYIMQHRYRNLPVVDAEGRFLGVFGVNCLLRLVLPKAVTVEGGLEEAHFVNYTLRDLRRRLKEVEDEPIGTCMVEEVAVVQPQTPLIDALLALYRTRSSVPVVDKGTGRLEGVISYWDVGSKVLEEEP